MKPTRVSHEIEPYCDENSEILILGSIPSVKSREEGFYYMHPQNRFWDVLSRVFKEEKPISISQKCDFLKRNHIALWDVIASCTITGSSDQSIQNITYQDLKPLLLKSKIRTIYTTGTKAYHLYQKGIYPKIQIEAIPLPSTSPANATYSLEKLVEAYQILRKEEP